MLYGIFRIVTQHAQAPNDDDVLLFCSETVPLVLLSFLKISSLILVMMLPNSSSIPSPVFALTTKFWNSVCLQSSWTG